MLTQTARSTRHALTRTCPPRLLRLLRLPECSTAPRSRYRLLLAEQHAPDRAFSTSRIHPGRFLISEGRTTSPPDEHAQTQPSTSPFYLETGYSIFAKRPSRPFPPPFVSAPSGSFSDPLTTHNSPRGRRPYVNGQLVRGITNGDDAIIIGDANFIAVDDGVGAWAVKDRGHAALWSRLIAHFWAVEVEKSFAAKNGQVTLDDLNPIQNLQDAYEQTKAATKGTLKDEEDDPSSSSSSSPEAKQKAIKAKDGDADNDKDKDKGKDKPGENDILGTTTASSALLHHTSATPPVPVILATTLGDCKVLILRPPPPQSSSSSSSTGTPDSSSPGGGNGTTAKSKSSSGASAAEEVDFSKTIVYRSTEQWHWFDCPRQLGTNSPDTPLANGVCDTVEVSPGDVVAVLSDGVTDNLWEHEIAETICTCVQKWESGVDEAKDGIVYVARTLMNAALDVAQDPNAESPYMERAFDEGIAAEGGKLDDISVVLGLCRKRESK
ncbi:hypothetical protein PV08_08874 [Exophiala spinifera]|uniref:Protein phosphatase n=1 Tax=Exophiala spinifera TaxID=91928 RepID=A0A0D2B416_9EURO|nr:uncharacterized protein PV08_08874 [Exophiala spinifera]KIW13683.1 hypothetical protein PV08_08874 [Exophiala spinifera]